LTSSQDDGLGWKEQKRLLLKGMEHMKTGNKTGERWSLMQISEELLYKKGDDYSAEG
jgi:hypothetical protein